MLGDWANLVARTTGEYFFSKNTRRSGQPTHEEISRLAFQIYVARGRRDGDDVEDWLRAEHQLLRQRG